MKALMLSHSDGGGGAGRASSRLLHAFRGQGIDAEMIVDFRTTQSPFVHRVPGPWKDARRRVRISIEEVPAYAARFPQPRLFSPAIATALSSRFINAQDADVVNLQWINFGFLSIAEIGRIDKPLTWSMHDMWPFTGGLNYDDDGPDARWRDGFTRPHPTPAHQWWDVDRWVWRRKLRHWRRPIHLIASSSWMASMAHDSPLTSSWPVTVIPNPVDTATYRPGSQHESRAARGIPHDAHLVAALFPKNLNDPRKGFDLFVEALEHLARSAPSMSRPIHVAIAGHDTPPSGATIAGLNTHWWGYLDDDASVDAYRASDVVVIPSRQDNSPQVATEAMACGTPVVAFDISGLPDFVHHERTGYLARPFDAGDLAHGIENILMSDTARRRVLSESARQQAEQAWSYAAVGEALSRLFEQVIEESRHQ